MNARSLPRREWFSAVEIVSARSPDLPGSARGINRLADECGWRHDPARARRANGQGGGWEYHLSALPPAAQARLLLAFPAPGAGPAQPQNDGSRALWATFEGLSEEHKAECRRRLAVMDAIEHRRASGSSETAAIQAAAAESGVSVRTAFGWRGMVKNVPRTDWLAALAPSYRPTATFAACHPQALDALKADYLRLEEPRFSACYRRVCDLAAKHGWLPIPSERALRRRIEAEVPAAVMTLARKGASKAKTLYPAQQRDRTTLHAMQAFNIDGHRFDVFVLLDDGRVVRLHLLALQDLYSGKILAWRLSETENKETVRLAIGDMVTRYGIPEKVLLDNGRAFASKWITGRAPNRYRFKVRDEEPQGLLTALGMGEPVWAKPYSGQSKPIERAFKDLTETIARHPICAGAYTGNKPDAKPENYGSRAVPVATFRAHVDREIAKHNARSGRTMASCGGRSFDETFEESMKQPTTLVRWPTEAQRSLWLLAAESIRAQRGSGEIHLFENRYWCPALNAWAGKAVVARFDPDDLQQPLLVYGPDDRLIGEAPCIAKTGFFDAQAAREHARDRGAYEKALREQRRLATKMSVDELARLLADEPVPTPAPSPPAVKRLAVGGTRAAPALPPAEDFETQFSRGLTRLIGEEPAVLPFVKPGGNG